MAIRSIKRNIDDAKKSVRTGKALDKVDTSKMTSKELEAYEMGMANRANAMFDRAEAKSRKPKRPTSKTGSGKTKFKERKPGKMGGGKVYTSSNKRYANGGKIYPSKGKS